MSENKVKKIYKILNHNIYKHINFDLEIPAKEFKIKSKKQIQKEFNKLMKAKRQQMDYDILKGFEDIINE